MCKDEPLLSPKTTYTKTFVNRDVLNFFTLWKLGPKASVEICLCLSHACTLQGWATCIVLLSLSLSLDVSSSCYSVSGASKRLSQLTSKKSQENWLLFKAQWDFPVGNLWHSPAAQVDEVAVVLQSKEAVEERSFIEIWCYIGNIKILTNYIKNIGSVNL